MTDDDDDNEEEEEKDHVDDIGDDDDDEDIMTTMIVSNDDDDRVYQTIPCFKNLTILRCRQRKIAKRISLTHSILKVTVD